MVKPSYCKYSNECFIGICQPSTKIMARALIEHFKEHEFGDEDVKQFKTNLPIPQKCPEKVRKEEVEWLSSFIDKVFAMYKILKREERDKGSLGHESRNRIEKS
jgi:hypothetical protein